MRGEMREVADDVLDEMREEAGTCGECFWFCSEPRMLAREGGWQALESADETVPLTTGWCTAFGVPSSETVVACMDKLEDCDDEDDKKEEGMTERAKVDAKELSDLLVGMSVHGKGAHGEVDIEVVNKYGRIEHCEMTGVRLGPADGDGWSVTVVGREVEGGDDAL